MTKRVNIILKFEVASSEQMQKLGVAFAAVANNVWESVQEKNQNIIAIEASPGAGKSTFLRAALKGFDPENTYEHTDRKVTSRGREVMVWENVISEQKKVQHRAFDRVLTDAYNPTRYDDKTMDVPERKHPGIDFVENPYFIPTGKIFCRIDICRKQGAGGERRVFIKIPKAFKNSPAINAFLTEVQELQFK